MNKIESEFDFYKLKNCIDPRRISWWKLVTRENSIPFIEKHIDILDNECLERLSKNPFAIDMLKRHMDKISWKDFVKNPNAIHVIDENFDKCIKSLDWRGRIDLLRHPNFIHIIKKHMDKIIDRLLCSNCVSILARETGPQYISLLETYLEKNSKNIRIISENSNIWLELAGNPNAIHILENHLEKLNTRCWSSLAKNPNAIHLIEQNLHKLNEDGWRNLSMNPNAIHILEQNIDKIIWYALGNNPNGIKILEKYPEKLAITSFFDYENISVTTPIFEVDYDAIKKRCDIYKEELMQIALHPSRIEQYLKQGILLEELDNYI